MTRAEKNEIAGESRLNRRAQRRGDAEIGTCRVGLAPPDSSAKLGVPATLCSTADGRRCTTISPLLKWNSAGFSGKST